MTVRRVPIKAKSLTPYRDIIGDELYESILALREDLKGMSAIHLNATPDGGGVAEMLRSAVPLLQGLGLDVEWYVIQGADNGFFDVTKKLHNMLQGHAGELTEFERLLYLRQAERLASDLRTLHPDTWVIHDPQPLAVVPHLGQSPSARIWRSHIDTSRPNPEALSFLLPFMEDYDWTIFSMPDYVPPALRKDRVLTFHPAIDPLSTKNQLMDPLEADRILARLGVDPDRPLMTQISRFDRWKDPLGVVEAFRIARKEIPGLQLVLVGVFSALDDPEAPVVYAETERFRQSDPDIYLFHDPAQVGDQEVSAFQTGADVVLQKSLREGFGLTVAEAMWKGTPVVGGNVGGIKLQIQDGYNGYLVDTVYEAADRVVRLFQDPQLRREMGHAARESVRRNFLLPRLLHDYLRLFADSQAVAKYETPVQAEQGRAAA
ncbi:MAG: glycosyltransferase [Chloroflexota bacterium]